MYRVYFMNFKYFSANTSDTLEGAKKIAKDAGFQSVVYDDNDEIVVSFCPISGFRTLKK